MFEATILFHLGRTREARQQLRQAVELRPLHGLVLANFAWVSYVDSLDEKLVLNLFGKASLLSPRLHQYGLGVRNIEALMRGASKPPFTSPNEAASGVWKITSQNLNLLLASRAIDPGVLVLQSRSRQAITMGQAVCRFLSVEPRFLKSPHWKPPSDLVLPALLNPDSENERFEGAGDDGDGVLAPLGRPPKSPAAGAARRFPATEFRYMNGQIIRGALCCPN